MNAYQMKRSEFDILHTSIMRLVELLEELSIENLNLNESQYYLINDSYTQQQWVDVSVIFLNGIDKQHLIPGTILLTIAGICDYYREHKSITPKQCMYLTSNLIRYWDQLSCACGARLML